MKMNSGTNLTKNSLQGFLLVALLGAIFTAQIAFGTTYTRETSTQGIIGGVIGSDGISTEVIKNKQLAGSTDGSTAKYIASLVDQRRIVGGVTGISISFIDILVGDSNDKSYGSIILDGSATEAESNAFGPLTFTVKRLRIGYGGVDSNPLRVSGHFPKNTKIHIDDVAFHNNQNRLPNEVLTIADLHLRGDSSSVTVENVNLIDDGSGSISVSNDNNIKFNIIRITDEMSLRDEASLHLHKNTLSFKYSGTGNNYNGLLSANVNADGGSGGSTNNKAISLSTGSKISMTENTIKLEVEEGGSSFKQCSFVFWNKSPLTLSGGSSFILAHNNFDHEACNIMTVLRGHIQASEHSLMEVQNNSVKALNDAGPKIDVRYEKSPSLILFRGAAITLKQESTLDCSDNDVFSPFRLLTITGASLSLADSSKLTFERNVKEVKHTDKYHQSSPPSSASPQGAISMGFFKYEVTVLNVDGGSSISLVGNNVKDEGIQHNTAFDCMCKDGTATVTNHSSIIISENTVQLTKSLGMSANPTVTAIVLKFPQGAKIHNQSAVQITRNNLEQSSAVALETNGATVQDGSLINVSSNIIKQSKKDEFSEWYSTVTNPFDSKDDTNTPVASILSVGPTNHIVVVSLHQALFSNRAQLVMNWNEAKVYENRNGTEQVSIGGGIVYDISSALFSRNVLLSFQDNSVTFTGPIFKSRFMPVSPPFVFLGQTTFYRSHTGGPDIDVDNSASYPLQTKNDFSQDLCTNQETSGTFIFNSGGSSGGEKRDFYSALDDLPRPREEKGYFMTILSKNTQAIFRDNELVANVDGSYSREHRSLAPFIGLNVTEASSVLIEKNALESEVGMTKEEAERMTYHVTKGIVIGAPIIAHLRSEITITDNNMRQSSLTEEGGILLGERMPKLIRSNFLSRGFQIKQHQNDDEEEAIVGSGKQQSFMGQESVIAVQSLPDSFLDHPGLHSGTIPAPAQDDRTASVAASFSISCSSTLTIARNTLQLDSQLEMRGLGIYSVNFDFYTKSDINLDPHASLNVLYGSSISVKKTDLYGFQRDTVPVPDSYWKGGRQIPSTALIKTSKNLLAVGIYFSAQIFNMIGSDSKIAIEKNTRVEPNLHVPQNGENYIPELWAGIAFCGRLWMENGGNALIKDNKVDFRNIPHFESMAGGIIAFTPTCLPRATYVHSYGRRFQSQSASPQEERNQSPSSATVDSRRLFSPSSSKTTTMNGIYDASVKLNPIKEDVMCTTRPYDTIEPVHSLIHGASSGLTIYRNTIKMNWLSTSSSLAKVGTFEKLFSGVVVPFGDSGISKPDEGLKSTLIAEGGKIEVDTNIIQISSKQGASYGIASPPTTYASQTTTTTTTRLCKEASFIVAKNKMTFTLQKGVNGDDPTASATFASFSRRDGNHSDLRLVLGGDSTVRFSYNGVKLGYHYGATNDRFYLDEGAYVPRLSELRGIQLNLGGLSFSKFSPNESPSSLIIQNQDVEGKWVGEMRANDVSVLHYTSLMTNTSSTSSSTSNSDDTLTVGKIKISGGNVKGTAYLATVANVALPTPDPSSTKGMAAVKRLKIDVVGTTLDVKNIGDYPSSGSTAKPPLKIIPGRDVGGVDKFFAPLKVQMIPLGEAPTVSKPSSTVSPFSGNVHIVIERNKVRHPHVGNDGSNIESNHFPNQCGIFAGWMSFDGFGIDSGEKKSHGNEGETHLVSLILKRNEVKNYVVKPLMDLKGALKYHGIQLGVPEKAKKLSAQLELNKLSVVATTGIMMHRYGIGHFSSSALVVEMEEGQLSFINNNEVQIKCPTAVAPKRGNVNVCSGISLFGSAPKAPASSADVSSYSLKGTSIDIKLNKLHMTTVTSGTTTSYTSLVQLGAPWSAAENRDDYQLTASSPTTGHSLLKFVNSNYSLTDNVFTTSISGASSTIRVQGMGDDTAASPSSTYKEAVCNKLNDIFVAAYDVAANTADAKTTFDFVYDCNSTTTTTATTEINTTTTEMNTTTTRDLNTIAETGSTTNDEQTNTTTSTTMAPEPCSSFVPEELGEALTKSGENKEGLSPLFTPITTESAIKDGKLKNYVLGQNYESSKDKDDEKKKTKPAELTENATKFLQSAIIKITPVYRQYTVDGRHRDGVHGGSAVGNPEGFTKYLPDYVNFTSKPAASSSTQEVDWLLTIPPIDKYEIYEEEALEVWGTFNYPSDCTGLNKKEGRLLLALVTVKDDKKGKAPTEVATTVISTGATAISVVGGVAGLAADQQGLAAVLLFGCQDPHSRHAFGSYRVLSPFAVKESYSGVVIGNFIAYVAVAVIQAIVLGVLRFIRRTRDLEELQAIARFPAFTMSIQFALHVGTVFASSQLISSPGFERWEVAVGALGFIYFAVFPVFLVVHPYFRIPRAYQEYDVIDWVQERKLFPKWLLFAVPQGVICSANTRKAYGSYVSLYRLPHIWWPTYATWTGTVTGLSGLFHPDTVPKCQALFSCMGIIFIILAIITIVLKPIRSLLGNYLHAASNILLAIVTFASAASLPNPPPARIPLFIFSITLTVCTAVRIIHSISCTVFDFFMWKHQVPLGPVWSHNRNEKASREQFGLDGETKKEMSKRANERAEKDEEDGVFDSDNGGGTAAVPLLIGSDEETEDDESELMSIPDDESASDVGDDETGTSSDTNKENTLTGGSSEEQVSDTFSNSGTSLSSDFSSTDDSAL